MRSPDIPLLPFLKFNDLKAADQFPFNHEPNGRLHLVHSRPASRAGINMQQSKLSSFITLSICE
jgi:hypothetical protein